MSILLLNIPFWNPAKASGDREHKTEYSVIDFRAQVLAAEFV
jgi:hypothetical protein